MGGSNRKLHIARQRMRDEFYTLLPDVERELPRYRHHFKDKVVYLNCDDPVESAFWTYFSLNFDFFGLKQLTSTHYDPDKPTYRLDLYEYDTEPVKTPLEGNGDFRNPESIKILEEADVVVTNPPFSLFREYLAQLVEYGKQFLILGNMNAITYKEVFPLIRDGKVWYGHSVRGGDMEFKVSDSYPLAAARYRIDKYGSKYVRVKSVRWFTNLDHRAHPEPLNCAAQYDPDLYPRYDNYDAIEVPSVNSIPSDYRGIMGVPITFLDKYNPEQFEIVGCSYSYGRPRGWDEGVSMSPVLDGRRLYKRLFIRHRNFT